MTYYKESKETILSIIHTYLEGQHSFEQLSDEVGIHKSTLKEWYLKWKVFGEEVFDNSFPQRCYTKEQKIHACI